MQRTFGSMTGPGAALKMITGAVVEAAPGPEP